MKKIIITKNREKALHTAISIDDILYEKFRRLNEQLDKRIEKYYRRPKQVIQIIKRGEKYDEVLMVKDVQITDEGTIVYV